MLTLNKATVRIWSKIGSRATYGQAILNLADLFPDLVVLSSDLGNSSGLDRFKSAHSSKFINVGIAEQNLIGVAAGIAKEGFTVFASSFAVVVASSSLAIASMFAFASSLAFAFAFAFDYSIAFAVCFFFCL